MPKFKENNTKSSRDLSLQRAKTCFHFVANICPLKLTALLPLKIGKIRPQKKEKESESTPTTGIFRVFFPRCTPQLPVASGLLQLGDVKFFPSVWPPFSSCKKASFWDQRANPTELAPLQRGKTRFWNLSVKISKGTFSIRTTVSAFSATHRRSCHPKASGGSLHVLSHVFLLLPGEPRSPEIQIHLWQAMLVWVWIC